MSLQQNQIQPGKEDPYFFAKRAEMLDFVPEYVSTLCDVGCGGGKFGQLVKEKRQCEVWGIEMNETYGKEARDNVDKLLLGDINELMDTLPDHFFDCLVFNDVLEHMIDPYTLLLKLKVKLTKRGVVISSIPNVRYFWNLYNLLVKKDWQYVDSGILDRTHFRFFTKKSMIKMYEDAGYRIEKIEGIHPLKSRLHGLVNAISLGNFSDSKYLQFAIQAKPLSN